MNDNMEERYSFEFLNIAVSVFVFTCFLGFFVYLFISGAGDLAASQNGGIGLIEIGSLLLFLSLLMLSFISERFFWFILPFSVFSIPNAVNAFFPSIRMGEAYINPFFSLFTHIDIFLLCGLVRFASFFKRVQQDLLVIFAVFCAYFIVFYLSLGGEEYLVSLMGGFQLRYFILLTALFLFANPLNYQRNFLLGLVFGCVVTTVEAFVFSYINTVPDRLASGNFGVNYLGHLMAAASIVAIFFLKETKGLARIAWFVIALLLLCVMIMSGTRSSVLFFIIASSVFLFFDKFSKGLLFVAALMTVGVLIFFYVYSNFGISLSIGVTDIVSGKEDASLYRTAETSSLITRLFTWYKTYYMYLDYNLLGAGPGMWSYLKLDYGIPYVGLLDPHNDVLHYAVSYGVFGLFFYLTVYLKPIFQYLRNEKYKVRVNLLYFSLLIFFFMASFVNSLTWKHQFAMLVFWFSLTLTCSIKKSVNTNV
tara:strand:- start:11081 stop:12514 length:1434 start_codon:yes stop_codon:yes gene_type:complete